MQSRGASASLKAPSVSSAKVGAPQPSVAGRRTTAPRTTSPTVSLRGALRMGSQPRPAPITNAPPAEESVIATVPHPAAAIVVAQQTTRRTASPVTKTPSFDYSASAMLCSASGGNAPIAGDGWVAAVLHNHLPPPVASKVRVTTTPINFESSLSVGSSRRLPPDTVSRAGSGNTVLTIPRLVLVPEETTTFMVPSVRTVGIGATHYSRAGSTTPRAAANDYYTQEESRVKVVIRDAPATHKQVQQFVAAATSPSAGRRAISPVASHRFGRSYSAASGVSASAGAMPPRTQSPRPSSPSAQQRNVLIPSMRSLEDAAREQQREAMRRRDYQRMLERDEFKESLEVLMYQNRKLDRAEARRKIREGGIVEAVPSPCKSPRKSAAIATAATDEYCFLPKVLTPRKILGRRRDGSGGLSSRGTTPNRVPTSSPPSCATTPRGGGGGQVPSAGGAAVAVTVPCGSIVQSSTSPSASSAAATCRTLPFGGDDDDVNVLTDASKSTDTPSQRLQTLANLRAVNEPLWVQLQAADPYPPPTNDPNYHRQSPMRSSRSPTATTMAAAQSRSPSVSPSVTPIPLHRGGSPAKLKEGTAAGGGGVAPAASTTHHAIMLPVQTPRALTRRILRDAHTQFEGSIGVGAAAAGRGVSEPTTLMVPFSNNNNINIGAAASKRVPSSSPAAPLPPPSTNSASRLPTPSPPLPEPSSAMETAAQGEKDGSSQPTADSKKVHLSERLASWGADSDLMSKLDELSPRRLREREAQEREMQALLSQSSPSRIAVPQMAHSPVNLRSSPSPTRGSLTSAQVMALSLSPQARFSSVNNSMVSANTSNAFQQSINYATPTNGTPDGTPTSSPARPHGSPQRSVILEERRLILEQAGIVSKKPTKTTVVSGDSNSVGVSTKEMIQKKLRLLGLPPDTMARLAPKVPEKKPDAPLATAEVLVSPLPQTQHEKGLFSSSYGASMMVSVASPPRGGSPTWIPSSPSDDDESEDAPSPHDEARFSSASPIMDASTATASPATSNVQNIHQTALKIRAINERTQMLTTMAEPEERAMVMSEESTVRNHIAINYRIDTEAHTEALAAAAQRRLQHEEQAAEWRKQHFLHEVQQLTAKEAAVRFGDVQQEEEVRRVLCGRYIQQGEIAKRIYEREGKTRAVMVACEAEEAQEMYAAFVKERDAMPLQQQSAQSPSAFSPGRASSSSSTASSASPSRCLSEELASPSKVSPPLNAADTSSVSTLHELSGILETSPQAGPSTAALVAEDASHTAAPRATSAEVGGTVAIATITDDPCVRRYLAWLREDEVVTTAASSKRSRAALADILEDSNASVAAFANFTHEVIMQEVCDDFGRWFSEGNDNASLGSASLFSSLPPRALIKRRYPHQPEGTFDGVLESFARQAEEDGALRFDATSQQSMADAELIVEKATDACLKDCVWKLVVDSIAQWEDDKRRKEEEERAVAETPILASAPLRFGTSPNRSLHPSDCAVSRSPTRRRMSI